MWEKEEGSIAIRIYFDHDYPADTYAEIRRMLQDKEIWFKMQPSAKLWVIFEPITYETAAEAPEDLRKWGVPVD